MTDLFSKAENALISYAKEFTPSGSEPKAIVHQWLHAIAYSKQLFCHANGASSRKVIHRLKKAGIYTSKPQFKEKYRRAINISPVKTPKFTFIDLFAGVGGTRQGMELAGGTCVFSSEFDLKAQETYFENYGEFPFGDITKIADESDEQTNWIASIPEHDVLVGGFPCQPFSHAGLKRGIEDTRGTLFDNIAQILKVKKPKFAVLENVKGLISHDKGFTLKTILRKLLQMGYQCSIPDSIIFGEDAEKLKKAAKHMVMKTKDFGLPQNRQRIYIVLWRKDLNIEFKYPEPPCTPTKVSDILESNPDEKYTISKRLWDGHKRRKINNKKNGKGFGYGLVTPESEYTNTISARYYKDGSECLVYQGEGLNPRKLTPLEASKLQGFSKKFIINKSDVQAYKQFGNSVSVPIVRSIATNIVREMEKLSEAHRI